MCRQLTYFWTPDRFYRVLGYAQMLDYILFSAPNSKARVHFTQCPLSVHSTLTFSIFDFSGPAEQNSAILDKQDLNILYQVCVFRADAKPRWPPKPLIGRNIFNFSSEQNSMKLDRKEDLDILYQVCVFRADWKTKKAAPTSDCLRHFRLF